MRQILIPIKPKWVAKILNGDKTLEIRKTAPKEWVDYLNGRTDKKPEPMIVNIYCTKDGYLHLENEGYWSYSRDQKYTYKRHGKVVARFVLRDVEMEEIAFFSGQNSEDFDGNCTPIYNDNLDIWAKESLVGREELLDRANKGRIYAWHISDLEIFDKPKELSNFLALQKKVWHDHESMSDYYERRESRKLKRAPRSWLYVEESL